MSEIPADSRSPSDDWLREALDRLRHELSQFGRTFLAFGLRPGRSAHAWQSGERTFMNPVGFGATSAAIYWGVTSVLLALWPVPGSDGSDTLTRQLASSVGPYLHYGLLGAAMHLALRLLGSRRSFLGSIGVAFLVGGSIGMLTAVLLSSTAGVVGHVRGTNSLELGNDGLVALIFLTASLLSYVAVCLVMVIGMKGLGRVALWKALTAGAFAIVVTAFLFGNVLPDGDYGWRPYIQFDMSSRAFSLGFRG